MATLEPSLFGLRLGLGHGLLGLALALVGVALALHGSWLLGCSLRFGLVEQSWSQLMEHGHPAEGNPSMGNHTAGHPTLRMNTQLPHGLCGFFAVDLDIPHRTGVDRVAACREEMAP